MIEHIFALFKTKSLPWSSMCNSWLVVHIWSISGEREEVGEEDGTWITRIISPREARENMIGTVQRKLSLSRLVKKILCSYLFTLTDDGVLTTALTEAYLLREREEAEDLGTGAVLAKLEGNKLFEIFTTWTLWHNWLICLCFVKGNHGADGWLSNKVWGGRNTCGGRGSDWVSATCFFTQDLKVT